MERVLKISGAYDGTTHPYNYGGGSMQLWFYVKGEKGGVSCSFSTSWFLPQNQERSLAMYTKGYPFNPCEELMQPKGTDVSYHSKTKLKDYLSPSPNCEVTDGDCYADGSSLYAREWVLVFLHEGSEGIFKRLEQYYATVFEDGQSPDLTPVPRTFKD